MKRLKQLIPYIVFDIVAIIYFLSKSDFGFADICIAILLIALIAMITRLIILILERQQENYALINSDIKEVVQAIIENPDMTKDKIIYKLDFISDSTSRLMHNPFDNIGD